VFFQPSKNVHRLLRELLANVLKNKTKSTKFGNEKKEEGKHSKEKMLFRTFVLIRNAFLSWANICHSNEKSVHIEVLSCIRQLVNKQRQLCSSV